MFARAMAKASCPLPFGSLSLTAFGAGNVLSRRVGPKYVDRINSGPIVTKQQVTGCIGGAKYCVASSRPNGTRNVSEETEKVDQANTQITLKINN
jgi:hypothetical protein